LLEFLAPDFLELPLEMAFDFVEESFLEPLLFLFLWPVGRHCRLALEIQQ
jgi:hypothetical protein